MVEGETVPSCSMNTLQSWKCLRMPEGLTHLKNMFLLTTVLLLAKGPRAMHR